MTRSLASADHRKDGRSNVFLTATLDTGKGVTAVRIRNLSPRGALLDQASLPSVGTRVSLKRGKLIALGEVAWLARGQGGINFDRDIDVTSWVQRVGHSGQQRVDGVVAAIRNSGKVPSKLQTSSSDDSLPAISAALDQVCEMLASAPGMSVELGEELLKLDTIAQSLRRLATGRAY